MSEDYENEESADPTHSISRRRMLKRIGAGAAIAWSAPILTSLRTPAFAASPACTSCFCLGQSTVCGEDANGACLLSAAAEGGCFCGSDILCGTGGACSSSGDCPTGWACMNVCCTGCDTAALQCLPPCGGGTVRATRGLHASGKRT